MSHFESLTSMSTASTPALTSNARRRRTSLIAPTSTPAKAEAPDARSPYSKALMHRRPLSLNLHQLPAPAPAPASATRSRPRPRDMLTKINTSLNVPSSSPDRPSRRPHGPRSACSPSPGISSTKSATRSHFSDVWKAKAGPSAIRTSPPRTPLPYDADTEQDPLFNISPDQFISHAPRRYRLKLVDVDPFSSDEDSPFDSLFSFTASPVESPSYAATTFHPRQLARPAPLPLHNHTHAHNHKSFFSPMSPDFVMKSFGNGDRVDRWIHGSGGLEPIMTPLFVDHSFPELWDDGGQSDWREIVDRFLQHEDDLEEPMFPPTPGGNAR